MVITKNSAQHNNQPGIKEITYVAMIPGPQPKPASRRICELPSLRYGSVGAKSIITGPLTVTRYYNETMPRVSSRKNKAFTIASHDMNLDYLGKSKRRVRFSLPPADHAITNASEAAPQEFSVCGDTYLANNNGRTARGLVSTSNGHSKKNSSSSGGGGGRETPQPHHASSVRLSTDPTNNTSAAALVYVNGSVTNAALTSRRYFNGQQQQQQQQEPIPASVHHHHYQNGNNSGLSFGRHGKDVALLGGSVGGRSVEYCSGGGTAKGKSGSAACKCGGSRREDKAGGVIVNRAFILASDPVPVLVTSTPPGVRARIHPTGKYIRGTLSPTVGASAPPNMANGGGTLTTGGLVLLRAARDGEDGLVRDVLRRASLVGIADTDLNASDNTGRTVFSYIASNGTIDILEQILLLPGLDINRPDSEGNTPLHFAAQAGQVECLNCMLTRCRGIDVDARNNLGFTALMKAALQGRNKCAKLLLFAGANPTLRDNGRGLRADQWARFCGRYVCADVIEKHARHRLLERSTSYNHWGGGENGIDTGARLIMGSKIMPILMPKENINNISSSNGIRSKLRKVFRTSSGPNHNTDNLSSVRLVTQLTTAALCASSPVLPSAPSGVPAVVKSLIRPLTVPKLQITLAGSGGAGENVPSGKERSDAEQCSVFDHHQGKVTSNGHDSFNNNNNNNDDIVVKNGRQKKKK